MVLGKKAALAALSVISVFSVSAAQTTSGEQTKLSEDPTRSSLSLVQVIQMN